MTDDRASTDGGETAPPVDVERAGEAPPAPPTGDGLDRLLPDLLEGTETVTTLYMVRTGLADGSDRSVGQRLVDAIEDQVTVVGHTLEAGLDPGDPELDVLIETDHDHGAVASSLARVGPVRGVVVADVTDAAEREIEADAGETVDAANANDVFQELQEEVGQEGYGEVVDELEDVSFPGGPDPEEEVDLEAETGIELEDDPEPIELDEDRPDPQEGDLDLDDEDLSAEELLGEGDREADEEVKAPDEKAIEDAIADVDLDDDDAEAAASAEDQPASEAQAAERVGDGQPADADVGADVPEPTGGDGEAPDEAGADEETVEAAGGAAAADEPAAAGAPPAVDGDMDAFAAQLVAALESGAISEERRTELREALGIESTHSLDVRMEYVQKRVDNLAAYTDAWEAFLSQEGSGREFMESVRSDIEAIEQRLEGGGGGGDADLDAVERRLDRIESTVETLEERHDEDVTRLDTRMDSVASKLDGRVQQVEETLDAMKEKVRALLEWREHIDDVING